MRWERLLFQKSKKWLKKVCSLAGKGHTHTHTYTHDATGKLRNSSINYKTLKV